MNKQSIQEDKKKSYPLEESGTSSSKQSKSPLVDNRPAAVYQRRIQELANQSSQVKRLKEFQKTATLGIHSKPQKPIQRVIQLRAPNPFAHGNNITSHHIIPHELLSSAQEKLGQNSSATTALFLPSFRKMTLARMLKGGDLLLIYRPEGEGEDIETGKASDLADPPFNNQYNMELGSLKQSQKARLHFKVSGGEYDFSTFETKYNAYRQDPSADESFDLGNLAQSFYEWQGGNLFQGPERSEAMPSDGFDKDAHLHFSSRHQAQLIAIYDVLREETGKETPSKTIIRQNLEQLAGITRDMAPPEYNPDKYVRIQDQVHLDLLKDVVLDTRRSRLQIGKSVPVEEAVGLKRMYGEREIYDAWKTYVATNLRPHSGKNENIPIEENFEFKKISMAVSLRYADQQQVIRLSWNGFTFNILKPNLNSSHGRKGIKGAGKYFMEQMNQAPT